MSVKVRYPHLDTPAGEPARLSRLPRVRVAQIVLDHLAHGWSVEEMCRQHPDLSPAEAHAAMLYYWDHPDAIDAEIRDEWDRARRERAAATPAPVVARLRAKGLA